MTNLQKRILTSLIALPISIFFVVKGGYFLLFFLIFILFAGMHELFSVFKKTKTILILSILLILSLYSIYYLGQINQIFLYYIIVISVSTDVGGYIFGKIFKWKKLSKISPKKTISGVFGSYFFSIISVVIFNNFYPLERNVFILAIIFSTVAQAGDLTVSYFKRKEKIKDTGKILPGHGGIFDRIDGLMFVSLLAFILVQFS
tara:strand:- start:166 stop:774 length:609 start_codon:yes stop_codon:yes gene_type:complete